MDDAKEDIQSSPHSPKTNINISTVLGKNNKEKINSEKTEPFFIIAINFPKTSIA